MDALTLGFVLIGIYFFGQFFVIFYVHASNKKLKNAIILKGRLISLMPVLTVTTIAPGMIMTQGSTINQQQMANAPPPGYNVEVAETKSYPPPYVP